jgi:hypothetical protein
MRHARLLLLPVLLLLAGCAEVWTRPGTSEAEAEAMQATCRQEALAAVPVNNVWMMVDPGGTDRERTCWRDDRGRERCTVQTRFRPPRYDWVDVNSRPRDDWRRQCMVAKGFSFSGYRPLRLE